MRLNPVTQIPWATSTNKKKLSPKITLHFKVLCESKATLSKTVLCLTQMQIFLTLSLDSKAKTGELAQHKTCIQSKTICVGMWNQISYDLWHKMYVYVEQLLAQRPTMPNMSKIWQVHSSFFCKLTIQAECLLQQTKNKNALRASSFFEALFIVKSSMLQFR